MTDDELRRLALRYEVRVFPGRHGVGFLARAPQFPTVFTSGETPEQALANGYEGIECAIEGLLLDGEPLPEPDARVAA